jgi:phospholipase/carboxylesterase
MRTNLNEQFIAWLGDQGADVMTEVDNGGHELRNSELIAVSSLFSTNRGAS